MGEFSFSFYIDKPLSHCSFSFSPIRTQTKRYMKKKLQKQQNILKENKKFKNNKE